MQQMEKSDGTGEDHRNGTRIFTRKQESHLEEYFVHSANIYHGLAPKEIRKLAFQCGQQFHIHMPPSWHKNRMAGKDWFAT